MTHELNNNHTNNYDKKNLELIYILQEEVCLLHAELTTVPPRQIMNDCEPLEMLLSLVRSSRRAAAALRQKYIFVCIKDIYKKIWRDNDNKFSLFKAQTREESNKYICFLQKELLSYIQKGEKLTVPIDKILESYLLIHFGQSVVTELLLYNIDHFSRLLCNVLEPYTNGDRRLFMLWSAAYKNNILINILVKHRIEFISNRSWMNVALGKNKPRRMEWGERNKIKDNYKWISEARAKARLQRYTRDVFLHGRGPAETRFGYIPLDIWRLIFKFVV